MLAAAPGTDGGPPDVGELSAALETLADLGVVDLGSDEEAGVLTVVLSRLGTWGVHGRLRDRGWQLPVAGQLAQDRAAVLLAALGRLRRGGGRGRDRRLAGAARA